MKSLNSRGIEWAALFMVLAAGAWYLISNWAVLGQGCRLSGDHALLLLGIGRAQHGEILVGPYSRHLFHHPGPIHLYLLAILDWLLSGIGSQALRASVGQLILNIGCLATAAILFARYVGGRLSPLVFVLLQLIFAARSSPKMLGNYWGPSSVMFPAVGLTLSCAAVSTGQLQWLPFATFTAVIMLSNHVSTIPVVAILYAGSLLLCYAAGQLRLRENMKALSISGIIWCVALLGPALDVVFNPHAGNVGQIVNFMRSQLQTHQLLPTLQYVLAYFSPWGSLSSAQSSMLGFLTLVLLVTIALSSRLRASIGTEADYIARICWAVVLIALVCVLSARKIRGDLRPFIMWFNYALAALAWALIYRALESRVPYGQRAHQILIALSVGASALVVQRLMQLPACVSDDSIRELVSQMPLKRDQAYLLNASTGWTNMARLALELERRGFKFCVEPRWNFLFWGDNICPELRAQARGRKMHVPAIVIARASANEPRLEGVVVSGGLKARLLEADPPP